MRKDVVGLGLIAVAVLACGGDVAEGAGQILHDAGELIADAGALLMDAGDNDAQASTDGGTSTTETVDLDCDIERTERETFKAGYREITHWYAEVHAKAIAGQVIGCEHESFVSLPYDPAWGTASTSGDGAPEPLSVVCGWATPFEQGQGVLRVHCGRRVHYENLPGHADSGERVKIVRATIVPAD